VSCRTRNLISTGDIFFGKNFGCLEQGVTPQILHDLDEVFPAYWVEWQFHLLHKLLILVPYDPLYRFLTVGHRFYDVCRPSLLCTRCLDTR
jgi:hypothetical protein